MRSPSASRKRASSATSPRTPSTTTPRTSRRCSSRASRSSRTSSARRQVINASELDTNLVRVGSLVAGKDDKGKAFEYAIVGSTEADPINGRLSNESPVGKALIGRKKGDSVAVPTPKGERKLTISKISVA